MPITTKTDAVLCLSQIARQLRYTAEEMDVAGIDDFPSMVDATADEIDRIAKEMRLRGEP
jgi:hypothetical protein